MHNGPIDLRCDSIEGGAFVSLLAPLQREAADANWREVLHEVSSPLRVIFIATTENEEVAGSVQLSLCPKEYGRHRAEVQKLLVHSRYRQARIGPPFDGCDRKRGSQRGISLIVLDTAVGESAEQFDLRLGCIRMGEISNDVCLPAGRRAGAAHDRQHWHGDASAAYSHLRGCDAY